MNADRQVRRSADGADVFLREDEEMAERIRAFEWAETPLGPMETWPQSLMTAVGIMLGAGSPLAIYWGPDLVLLYNNAWRPLIGDKHPDALGRPAREAFPEIWHVIGPMLAQVMSGRGAVRAHDQKFSLDRGGRREDAWFDYSYNPIQCEDGSIGGVLGIAVETTQRVRAEERVEARAAELTAAQRALRQAARQYSELVQHAPAAIYEVNFRENRFTSVNEAMCQMLGYSPEELLAINPSDILDEDGRALFRSRIARWLSGEEPDRNVEFGVKTRDGRIIDAILDVTFTADEQGRPLGAAVVAHDITERKERERQVARYNRVLRGINRIFEQMIRAETEKAVGETCLAVALDVTGSQVGFVGEVGADGLLHDIAVSDMGRDQCRMVDQTGHRRPPGDFVLHGLYGRVIDDEKGFFTNDPPSHPHSIGVPDGHPPLTSFLGVPLTHEGKTVGMLAVANREGGYGGEQLEDLEALAPAVVEALLRKRAEVELRGERQLLETIYDTIPVMLTIYDPRIQEVWFNKHVERVTGWTPEDTARTHLMELVYPDPAYREKVAEYMQSLDPGFMDIRMATKDGRMLETSWANVRIPDGRQVGIGIDITQRKRAEEALRHYADRLHFLHEVDEAILGARSGEEVAEAVVERVPRLVPCQRATVGLYDPQTDELSLLAVYADGETELGKGWHEPVVPDWDPVLARLRRGEKYVVEDLRELTVSSPLLAQLRAEGVRAHVYEPVITRGHLVGSLSIGRSEPGPLPAEQMEVVQELALTLAVGLEQARLHEELQRYAGELEGLVDQRTAALEASEARFRTIFEEAGIGIALVDAEGGLMATNPALQQMLGYDEQELAGSYFFDFLDGAEEDGRTLLQTLLTGRRREYTQELVYLPKDGEVGEANLTMSLLQRDSDASPLLLALVEDITERKQTREILIEAERLTAMGRMGASLAHEINNPLQSVIGCLGLAMEAREASEDTTYLMDVALQELKRAANIVRRMRDLSRPGEGEKKLGSVHELVEKVVALTRKQAENHRVEVIWEGADGLPSVPVVRERIQQVFLNLVLNAIDAMPEGGELLIQGTRTEETAGVEISFTDTGVGIAPEESEGLFEAFRSNKDQGLGLGLYVSRSIVQEHGGRIEVDSEAGHGATFTVWLPGEEGAGRS